MEDIKFKDTKFWIHRCLAEYCSKSDEINQNISLMNYQSENFDKMRPEVQKEVIANLNKIMESFCWDKRIIFNED